VTPQLVADIASVDDPGSPDYHAFAAAGGRAVIVRAAYGRRATPHGDPVYVDETFAREAPRVRQAGLRLGGYLFLCVPRPGADTPQPEAQADAFCAAAKLEPYRDTIPWIDVEEEPGFLSHDAYYEWVARAWRRVRDRYGVAPGVYTSKRVWRDHLGDHALGELVDAAPWVCAPWPWGERTQAQLNPGAFRPWVPTPWADDWDLYQYQGDSINCPGFHSTTDLSVVRITRLGDRGNHVARYRRLLGLPDGTVYDQRMLDAVYDLQIRHGLYMDGVIGIDTLCALWWNRLVEAMP
jgi:GH25 family lysozyme M1 (1,4-beta-N-acetylmuramidase)